MLGRVLGGDAGVVDEEIQTAKPGDDSSADPVEAGHFYLKAAILFG